MVVIRMFVRTWYTVVLAHFTLKLVAEEQNAWVVIESKR